MDTVIKAPTESGVNDSGAVAGQETSVQTGLFSPRFCGGLSFTESYLNLSHTSVPLYFDKEEVLNFTCSSICGHGVAGKGSSGSFLHQLWYFVFRFLS